MELLAGQAHVGEALGFAPRPLLVYHCRPMRPKETRALRRHVRVRPRQVAAAHRFWTTLLCAMLGVVGCRRVPEQHPLGDLPRCYRLAVGPWKIPQDARYPEQRTVYPTPQLLRLDPAALDRLLGFPLKNSTERILHGESGDSAWSVFERSHPVRVWRVERDVLVAAFGTGNSGLSMYLRIVGDSLLGDAGAFTDRAGMEYPTASVIGVRVSCPRA
jgi:hypothetical protein